MKRLKQIISEWFTPQIETPEKTAKDFCTFIEKYFTPTQQAEIIDIVKKETLMHFKFVDNEYSIKVEELINATERLKNV